MSFLISRKTKYLNRKIHRVGAIIIALPLLVVIGTGLLLQVKKQFTWVQPATAKGSAKGISVTFEQILATAKTVPEAKISSWQNVNRLDVRPGKGVVKVRSRNNWEVQIDTKTLDILQVEYRRSDLIEALHDGSWFHDAAKLWVFLPAAIILLVLWFTGVYMYFLPYLSRRLKGRADRRPSSHLKA